MRILVVEDDALIREFGVEVLREEGCDVIHAANGAEALAWCGPQVADVLITDVGPPGGTDGGKSPNIAESETFRQRDDLSQILPPDVSDHFVRGFRERCEF
ncbi:response regulator [Bradyrhizobium sp. RT9a]|uniref:response regulator n=1 Tax=Bradyrhizobium sp. RT9a TaxID=3156384 RepID=UPI0033965CDC